MKDTAGHNTLHLISFLGQRSAVIEQLYSLKFLCSGKNALFARVCHCAGGTIQNDILTLTTVWFFCREQHYRSQDCSSWTCWTRVGSLPC